MGWGLHLEKGLQVILVQGRAGPGAEGTPTALPLQAPSFPRARGVLGGFL